MVVGEPCAVLSGAMARLAAEPFASSTTSGVQLALRRANMRLMGLSGAAGREEKNLGYLSLIFT